MQDTIILILEVIAIVITLSIMIFIICSCVVSGRISKKEEYRKLDSKELDNEQKWDNDIYDEDFIKKEDVNGN